MDERSEAVLRNGRMAPEETLTRRVIRATEIAKLAEGEPGGDPEMAIFGKIIEEEATFEAHLRSKRTFWSRRSFIRKISVVVRDAGLSREYVRDAWCIEATLRRAGLLGYSGKPRTQFREHPSMEGVLIAGQPDLEGYQLSRRGDYSMDIDYMEFTLAGVNPYQRAKTAVMAYACDSPVRLVGLRREGHLWDYDEVEMTPDDGLQIIDQVPIDLLVGVGTVQEVCEDCGLPRCTCPVDRWYNDWDDDE